MKRSSFVRATLAATLAAGVIVSPVGSSDRNAGNRAQSQPSDIRPYASLQELMDGIVDPAADQLWDSVETIVTSEGEQTREPRSPQEWQEVRRHAITLIEAANLLVIDGRRVATKPFPPEAAGALDSEQIQQRIATNRVAFNLFAGALSAAAQKALVAIDAHDTAALVQAGGMLDGVCESCHSTFWYPNQVIPPLPRIIPPLSDATASPGVIAGAMERGRMTRVAGSGR